MIIEKEKIQEAKLKVGSDKTWEIMKRAFGLANADDKNHKACCPFHNEKTPSFILNEKTGSTHCFGCNRSADIIDAYMYEGKTYMQALEELFKEAKMKVSFGELGVKTARDYKYPHVDDCGSKDIIYDYLAKRKISKETVDKAGLTQDSKGNIVFNYYDTNDVLCMCKYRPSHKIDKSKGEAKNWCQAGADTMPLLFNMNKVNVDLPLVITEGEGDSLAAIESGFPNAVSVPFGSQNTQWIEKNWEWLEQFSSIIICSDNDEAGVKMRKEVIPRLGAWRTKYIDIPKIHHDEATGKDYPMKDLNEVLFYEGKDGVRKLFDSACDPGVPSVKNVSEIHDMDLDEVDGIMTGISDIDRELMRLFYGTLTVVSGKPGCVDKDTEYFNGKEWKKISEFTVGEKVLQYNPETGTAELVIPEQYIKIPEKEFWHIKNRNFDQCVSDSHVMAFYERDDSNLRTESAETFVPKLFKRHGYSTPAGFIFDGEGIDLTDEQIELMCAVICDGTFSHNQGTRCRFHLKKDRKKQRLLDICKRAGVEVRIRKSSDIGYDDFYLNAPMRLKEFTPEWYSCSQHQLQIICDNVRFWDGHFYKNGTTSNFSSNSRVNADFVQFAFAGTGHRSGIYTLDRREQKYIVKDKLYTRKSVDYRVNFANTDIVSFPSGKRKNTEIERVSSIDGYKYCFTMQTHYWVSRRNGKISILHNSGKTSFLSQVLCHAMDEGKPVWMFSREMPDWMQKNWFNYILAGGHHIETKTTSTGTEYYKVATDAKDAIDKYYDNRWFLYRDEWSNKFEDVLVSMEDSVRKYGAKLLIIDNLMMLDLGGSDDSKLEKQTECITSLIKFAMKYSVAIVLVAHPRKTPAGEELNMYDVAGSSNIINLAHRTLGLRRINQDKEHSAYNVKVTILKDRLRGMANKEINMYYDMGSRRFYTNEEEYNHQYGWDNGRYDALPYPHNEEDEVFGKDE